MKPTPAKHAPIPLTRARVLWPCRDVVATARSSRLPRMPAGPELDAARIRFRASHTPNFAPGDWIRGRHGTVCCQFVQFWTFPRLRHGGGAGAGPEKEIPASRRVGPAKWTRLEYRVPDGLLRERAICPVLDVPASSQACWIWPRHSKALERRIGFCRLRKQDGKAAVGSFGTRVAADRTLSRAPGPSQRKNRALESLQGCIVWAVGSQNGNSC